MHANGEIIFGSTMERFADYREFHERTKEVRICAIKPHQQQVDSIIDRFDEKVRLILTKTGKEPMEAFEEAILKPPVEVFDGYACLAYDGRSLDGKQRCARCRGTFGCH